MECRDCQHQNKHGLGLCSQCGRLLGGADIAQRVHRKLSQLARFGLAGWGRLLKKAG